MLLNTSIVNYRICDSLPDGVKVIDAEDPTVVMKAVKNEVQLENLRKAHLRMQLRCANSCTGLRQI